MRDIDLFQLALGRPRLWTRSGQIGPTLAFNRFNYS